MDLSSTILSKYTDGDLGPFLYCYLTRHKHKSVLHDSAASYVDAWSMHGSGEHAPEIQQTKTAGPYVYYYYTPVFYLKNKLTLCSYSMLIFNKHEPHISLELL